MDLVEQLWGDSLLFLGHLCQLSMDQLVHRLHGVTQVEQVHWVQARAAGSNGAESKMEN